MKRIRFFILGAFVLMGSIQVQAAGAKVGWIDGLMPTGTSADAVNILREGKSVPYTPANRLIFEGDQISLAKDGLTLKLVIGENTVLVKSNEAKPNAPYVIKLTGEIPTVQKNLLDWIGDKLDGKKTQRNSVKTISASARSAAGAAQNLTIPVLEQSNAQLVGGKRDLQIHWQGGVMPYRIVLKQGNTETTAENLSDLKHTFLGVTLQESKLELVLEDSKGKRYVDAVRIVPESRRPAMPVPLKEARLDNDVRNRLYGEWLMEQSTDWALEALQWLER